MLFGQTTELIKEGQSFADKFGWEALVIVIFFGFTIYTLWNFGGRLINAVVSYIDVTREQMVSLTSHQGKIADQQFELSRAISSLATSKTNISATTDSINANVDRFMIAAKMALLAVEESLPDDKMQLKVKIRHAIAALDQ